MMMSPKYPIGTLLLNGGLVGVIVDNTCKSKGDDIVYVIRWTENGSGIDVTYSHRLLQIFDVFPIGE
jgi:hypothetical protein